MLSSVEIKRFFSYNQSHSCQPGRIAIKPRLCKLTSSEELKLSSKWAEGLLLLSCLSLAREFAHLPGAGGEAHSQLDGRNMEQNRPRRPVKKKISCELSCSNGAEDSWRQSVCQLLEKGYWSLEVGRLVFTLMALNGWWLSKKPMKYFKEHYACVEDTLVCDAKSQVVF